MRQRATSTIDMFQDRFGQRPLTRTDSVGNRLPAMIVNVWNLRFMQSELGNPADELPLITSSLQLAKNGGEIRIKGTITNRGPAPLQGISIATKTGVARVYAPIAPPQPKPCGRPTVAGPLSAHDGSPAAV